ncbi:hypothetical protein [Chitinophaga sp. Cy-1792]|uniref:hypothetical protein n=1 Tax=Chitinophaga sp. Cy-1792 TaxID=2608339 RepID=UPI001422F1E7|nr:hypothetical protein [Chitinophaga sp. Cy-1792]NIG56106.1 hypothetical protein [Chitinophaga sp. Cy-1792]
MADMFILIKNDNQYSAPMDQMAMQTELRKYIDKESYPNLSQSLNDVADGKGKATQPYTYPDGTVNMPVLHASSGKIGADASISLFWYDKARGKDKDHYIIAMGEHTTNTTYKLVHYGQSTGQFKLGAKISI